MTDQELIREIDDLVEEERQLHEHGVGRGLTPEEQQRLTAGRGAHRPVVGSAPPPPRQAPRRR